MADLFGSPTYTREMAANIKAMIKTSHYGLYNMAGKDQVSRYDMSREILRFYFAPQNTSPFHGRG